MFTQWIIVLGGFLISSVVTAFLFSKLVFFREFRERNFSATASVVLGCLITCLLVLPFCWDEYDFVSSVGIGGFVAPLIGLIIIFATCFINRLYVIEFGVLVASLIGVFAGDLFIDIIPSAPVFVNKLCSVLLWFLFSIGIRCVATLYPILQIQSLTVSAGIVLLYIFGGLPFIIGFVGATLLGAMCIAYLHYMNQSMGVEVSPIVGYFIGWFGFLSYSEMAFPCYVILVMFCVIEMTVSIIKKLTFMKKYEDFNTNSFCFKIYKSGLPPITIIRSLWLLSGLVVIFAVLQANGVNSYSIPCFVALIMCWQFYKLINWKEENKTWKEKKEEVIEDIKETINLVTKPKKKTKNSNTKKTKTVKGRKNANN
ncbi:MAG: hypothetical protein E7004_02640 [Alphaproteobacteria bacterium]|nr:hypothetical protein [Alphaproteobacteria bacterium]